MDHNQLIKVLEEKFLDDKNNNRILVNGPWGIEKSYVGRDRGTGLLSQNSLSKY
jgi:hypothetical protein